MSSNSKQACILQQLPQLEISWTIPLSVTHIMAKPTKANYVEELRKLGEVAPKSWTTAEVQMRLSELKEELGLPPATKGKVRTPLRQMLIELNKAKAKKSNLQLHLNQVLKVPVTGNETIKDLMEKGLAAVYEAAPATEQDPMGFGTHAAKTYGEVFYQEKGYTQWAQKTSEEGPNDCSRRLSRFVTWTMAHQQTLEEKFDLEAITKPAKKPVQMEHMTGELNTSKSSASSSSETMDQMKEMMQQLMKTVGNLTEEVQTLKEEKPHKEHKGAKSDASMGSFDLLPQ